MTIELGITIAMFTLALAFSTWLSGTKREAGKQDAHNAEVKTMLNNIGEDVKDIKAEHRNLRNEVNEAKRIAIHAQERAEAAHNRIDRSGIDAHD